MALQVPGRPGGGLFAGALATLATLGTLATLATLGCGKQPSIDRQKAAALFTEVVVETEPGLSGLAADDLGGYWTVAERGAEVYRVTLGERQVAAVQRFSVRGVPAGTDLEGIAVLDLGGPVGADGLPRRFALGTEGQLAGKATVLLAERAADVLTVTGTIALPEAVVGIELRGNQGAEGVCGAGDTIFAAIEGAGEGTGEHAASAGRRWCASWAASRSARTRCG
ncbi:MAG: hypothetical protein IPI49_14515 [Myxococcales bacterium]|nr:hypothetical protein [Myxococcales bacterium]